MKSHSNIGHRKVGWIAAALCAAFIVTTLAPAAAFDAYWFTQRRKNLRADTGDDDPPPRAAPGQRAAPQGERCPPDARGRNGQRRAEDCN